MLRALKPGQSLVFGANTKVSKPMLFATSTAIESTPEAPPETTTTDEESREARRPATTERTAAAEPDGRTEAPTKARKETIPKMTNNGKLRAKDRRASRALTEPTREKGGCALFVRQAPHDQSQTSRGEGWESEE